MDTPSEAYGLYYRSSPDLQPTGKKKMRLSKKHPAPDQDV